MRSCPGRAKRDPGSRGHTNGSPAESMLRSAILALGPGSRSARARALAALGRDTSVRSRGAQSEPLALSRFTMSNSAVLFVPAALCCARVCASLRGCLHFASAGEPTGLWRQRPSRQQQFRPPDEGWMERRQPHSQLRSRLRRATPHPGATGITLGAPPWRFSDADPRSRLPAVEPEPAATSRARPYDWRSGSGPPCGAVRAASAGRHSWLRLAGSFLENAPSEPGCKSCTINSLRSQ